MTRAPTHAGDNLTSAPPDGKNIIRTVEGGSAQEQGGTQIPELNSLLMFSAKTTPIIIYFLKLGHFISHFLGPFPVNCGRKC